MKFKFTRKKHHKKAHKKELPRVKTSSILLRRDKGIKGPSGVVYHGQTQRDLAKLGLLRKVSYGHQRKRALDSSEKRFDQRGGGPEYDPFLLHTPIPAQDVCVQRIQRREVLFAQGVAGKNLRKSPGQGGTYKPSQGPCERRT